VIEVDLADPHHLEFAVLGRDAAGLPQQGLAIANAHDGGVDLARQRTHARQAFDPALARHVLER